MTSSVYLLMTVIVLLVSASLVLLHFESRKRAIDARVSKAVGNANSGIQMTEMIGQVSKIGLKYRKLFSSQRIEQLHGLIQVSGFNPHRILPILIGSKIVLSLICIPLAIVASTFYDSMMTRLTIIGIGLAIGVAAPDLVLKIIRRRYNAAIQVGTPEAIDLLVVCSEAGMGLEGGLERVAEEMKRSNPATSMVLEGLLNDLRNLPSRSDAFNNLALRSNFEGLRRFGVMINQSIQFGTPLADALRAVADELRRERMNKLEEKATKLGAKLLFPMVLFMLPATGVIIAGGSFLHMIDSFRMVGQASTSHSQGNHHR